MKCLFFSGQRYSINHSVSQGFIENNWDIKIVDYFDFFSKTTKRVNNQIKKIPNKFKKGWESSFEKKINERYLSIFNKYNPDIVLIYNNQNIHPETVSLMKKTSKIVFILGDNPMYSPTNQYNVRILFYADAIICPDSFWVNQLQMLGIKNLYNDYIGFNEQLYFPMCPTESDYAKYKSDIVYVGIAYNNNRGFKRFHFLNQFSSFDIKSYMTGKGYSSKWKHLFPDIESSIIPHNEYSVKFNNLVYNYSKIAPIELTPSLFHGIHVRMFDALGSNILPLCEYSKDLEIVFKGIDFPSIKNYSEIVEITKYYLDNDTIRKKITAEMRERVINEYSPSRFISRLLGRIGV